MTKQEEIREGIEDTIGSWFLDHKDILKIAPLATKGILTYLHSQGVVILKDIKMDRLRCSKDTLNYLIDELDYKAVEALIKE